MVTYSPPSLTARHWRLALCAALALILLAACQEAPASQPPILTPSPATLILPGDLLRASPAPNAEVTTGGYLIDGADGAALFDGLTFEADGRPRPLATNAAPIWLGDSAASLRGVLRVAGSMRFGAVLARGRLEGPGAFGPAGQYRYRLTDVSLAPLAAVETTVGEVLDRPASYEGRLVRIVGGLLARDQSALLVDRLGVGGLPAPKARQIKLRTPLRDQALLDRLKGATGGAVRFGQVQIEGFMRGGGLAPIAITLVS